MKEKKAFVGSSEKPKSQFAITRKTGANTKTTAAKLCHALTMSHGQSKRQVL